MSESTRVAVIGIIVENPGFVSEINEILHSSARVEPTIGTNGESGTGIGLLLCRELIRLNKGTLDIRSGNGQTTFSLSLPAAEQTENER